MTQKLLVMQYLVFDKWLFHLMRDVFTHTNNKILRHFLDKLDEDIQNVFEDLIV